MLYYFMPSFDGSTASAFVQACVYARLHSMVCADTWHVVLSLMCYNTNNNSNNDNDNDNDDDNDDNDNDNMLKYLIYNT